MFDPYDCTPRRKKAVWELYAQKRIPLMSNGAVKGGPAIVVKELKDVLKALVDRP